MVRLEICLSFARSREVAELKITNAHSVYESNSRLILRITLQHEKQFDFLKDHRGEKRADSSCKTFVACKATNCRTIVAVADLLRQTYGERFLDDRKECVFASEFRRQKKSSTTIVDCESISVWCRCDHISAHRRKACGAKNPIMEISLMQN
jgi:hypothetical protein